jgi:hypothetical protein
VSDALDQALAALNFPEVRRQYWAQNEVVVLPGFLPASVVEELLLPRVRQLKPRLNRNYIPGHKKGGSVGYFTVREEAPELMELYSSDAYQDFLRRLTDVELQRSPDDDPHACALYYYTEAGDHIGWHYDTSYYKGARYTVLLGLVDQTTECRLECQLFKNVPGKDVRTITVPTKPGDMVIFNGDKLWHRVTPMEDGGDRAILTMEYVTNQDMSALMRIYSNLKDAFAYFGLKAVFGGVPARRTTHPSKP